MFETALVGLMIVVLFWITYVVASAAMQLFTLADRSTPTPERPAGRSGRLLDALEKDPREVLLAAELFKSLTFLMIAVLVIWEAPRWSGRLGWPWFPFTVAGLVMVWLLRIIVGEVLPKIAPAEEIEAETTPRFHALALVWWVFRPILVVTRRISAWRPPIDRGAEREDIVEHAIDTLAEAAGMDEPVIEPDERKMIQGVIGLEDTEVREVMVPRIDIVAVSAGASVDEVRRLITESGHSRLPVYEDDIDSIVGILYVKDLFLTNATLPIDLAALARRAFVIPETKKVDALLEEFKRQKKHIAIVVDEFGGTAGLVTLEDILEEIVGEIEDEHDQANPAIEWLGDGIMRAEGVVPLEEVAEAFGIELTGDEFETIGGLIYDRVGGVPGIGQSFEEHGLTFTIEKMDGQRIRQIRIERHQTP